MKVLPGDPLSQITAITDRLPPGWLLWIDQHGVQVGRPEGPWHRIAISLDTREPLREACLGAVWLAWEHDGQRDGR